MILKHHPVAVKLPCEIFHQSALAARIKLQVVGLGIYKVYLAFLDPYIVNVRRIATVCHIVLASQIGVTSVFFQLDVCFKLVGHFMLAKPHAPVSVLDAYLLIQLYGVVHACAVFTSLRNDILLHVLACLWVHSQSLDNVYQPSYAGKNPAFLGGVCVGGLVVSHPRCVKLNRFHFDADLSLHLLMNSGNG